MSTKDQQQEQADRWAALRKAGIDVYPTEAFEQLAKGRADGSLDLLALITGVSRMPDPVSGLIPPFNLRLHLAKQRCLDDEHTWRMVAEAMGEFGVGRQAEARVRARFNQNQQTWEAMKVENGS